MLFLNLISGGDSLISLIAFVQYKPDIYHTLSTEKTNYIWKLT